MKFCILTPTPQHEKLGGFLVANFFHIFQGKWLKFCHSPNFRNFHFIPRQGKKFITWNSLWGRLHVRFSDFLSFRFLNLGQRRAPFRRPWGLISRKYQKFRKRGWRTEGAGGQKGLAERRGWRTEGLGARKSLPHHKFSPFFCPLFPMRPYEQENTILGDNFCCILGALGRQPPPHFTV